MFRTAREMLHLQHRPTAVFTLDDSLGLMLSFQARRHLGLKVPEDLSIVSFHDWSFLTYVEPALTTVRFDFFGAGQRAAEALSNAALTGQPVCDIDFQPTYRPGPVDRSRAERSVAPRTGRRTRCAGFLKL
ncbi:MAG: substrate-binding domain-containing protein [Verrucomicrobiota bacterium]